MQICHIDGRLTHKGQWPAQRISKPFLVLSVWGLEARVIAFHDACSWTVRHEMGWLSAPPPRLVSILCLMWLNLPYCKWSNTGGGTAWGWCYNVLLGRRSIQQAKYQASNITARKWSVIFTSVVVLVWPGISSLSSSYTWTNPILCITVSTVGSACINVVWFAVWTNLCYVLTIPFANLVTSMLQFYAWCNLCQLLMLLCQIALAAMLLNILTCIVVIVTIHCKNMRIALTNFGYISYNAYVRRIIITPYLKHIEAFRRYKKDASSISSYLVIARMC